VAASESSFAVRVAAGPLVLDGGLATELERRGFDLGSHLWSARLLHDDPSAILDVHRAFVAAGAELVTAASYQASFDGFHRAGMGARHAGALMTRSIELARAAEPRYVAASIGPYGATRADGSEYTGVYVESMSLAALREFHRRRLDVFAAATPDVLAAETIPAAAEAEAILAEVQHMGQPAWLSLTIQVDPEGHARTRHGEDAADVFAMAADVDAVVAVGVNCSEPGDVPAGIVAARRSGKPILVYPNSGERWDGRSRRWRGRPTEFEDEVPTWIALGARGVGGCCRVGPDAIAKIADRIGAPPTSGCTQRP